MQVRASVLIPHQKHLREIVEHDVWPGPASQARCLSSLCLSSRMCENKALCEPVNAEAPTEILSQEVELA